MQSRQVMKKNNSNKYKHKNNDDSRNSLLLKYIKKSPKEVWVRLIEIYAKEENKNIWILISKLHDPNTIKVWQDISKEKTSG